jgi:hypothetical protein
MNHHLKVPIRMGDSGRQARRTIRYRVLELHTKETCMSLHKFLFMAWVLTFSLSAQDAPEWTKKTFPASPERVFAAAIQSIAAQHYNMLDKDDGRLLAWIS